MTWYSGSVDTATHFHARYDFAGAPAQGIFGMVVTPPRVTVWRTNPRTNRPMAESPEEWNRLMVALREHAQRNPYDRPDRTFVTDKEFHGFDSITSNFNDIVTMDVSGMGEPVGRDNITLDLLGGDDWFTLSTHTATVRGGLGDDYLAFKTNGNTAYGGFGDDLVTFVGMTGEGVDIIYTGPGADMIITGASVDPQTSPAISKTEAEDVAIAFGFALSRALAGLVPNVGGFISAGIVAVEKYCAITREVEEPESDAQNFQSVKDFDPSLDVYVYNKTETSLRYLSEDYDTGKVEIYSDQSKNNDGGIIAELIIDSEFIDKINDNTVLSDRLIKKQISECIVDKSLKISKNGTLRDSKGREIDISDFEDLLSSNVYDAVQEKIERISANMDDGESLAAYGATGGKIIQGGDITSVGIIGEVWVVGTDRYSDFLVGATLGNNGNANDLAHLFGFGEDDVLIGTDGDDHLTGGRDDDRLTGNAGADTFHYGVADDGHDLITDFDIVGPEPDVIEISWYLFEGYDDILTSASQDGPDTVITLDDAFSITLADIQKDDLSPELFVIV